MKKFILDTDIGADCDDAAALLYLLGKMKAGECEIKAITLCTCRKFASAAAKAFVTEFGYGEIPIGEYKGKPLPCDGFDHYAEVVAGGVPIKAENAVKIMRKTLAENDKTDIICIGPACNIAGLLESGADEYSDKRGDELVKERVGKLYLMGGAFEFSEVEKPFAEWNIEQDIESAKTVFEKFPCEIVICPSEAGARVATKARSTKGLTRKAMEAFFKSIDERGGTRYEENPERTRPSWDPLNCMAAMNEKEFSFSEEGEVKVSDDGFTEFIKTETGKRRYMTLKNDYKKAEKELNEYLEKL